MYILIAFSSYPVSAVPSRPPCSLVNFWNKASIFLALSSLSFFFFASAYFFSLAFFSASSLAFFFLANSSSFFFLAISFGFSPEPGIYSAFNSISSAACRAANAAVASFVSRFASSYFATAFFFYFSLNSLDYVYFIMNSASAFTDSESNKACFWSLIFFSSYYFFNSFALFSN